VKFGRQKIGKIVSYLPDKKTKFRFLSNCRYCADRAQNLPGTATQSAPNRFTFGEVRPIAERVNTAKSPRKINPLFDRSLALSRIITTSCKLANGKWSELCQGRLHCYLFTDDSRPDENQAG